MERENEKQRVECPRGQGKSRQEWLMATNVCDIVIYNKKYIFNLCPYSEHRTPEALNFLRDESNKGVFVILMR